ncbi:MAG: MATE family efflux transporter [Lentisphaeria bacterium]
MRKKFLEKHLNGMGGIIALLPIAIPMIVSNIFDTLMTVIDRLFMGYVGKEQMAACMGGGLTAWACMTFFVGTVSYVSAMVARSYGANKKKDCILITYQGLYFAILAYPLILLLGFFASMTFVWAGHDPVEIKYELIYFKYMLLGSFLAVLRMALASFFSGIGKTAVILRVNAVALVVNVGANYILIFGKFGCPAMGIHGAAIGTLLASATVTGLLFMKFLKYSHLKEYFNRNACRYQSRIIKLLLRFGVPTGVDNMLATTAFTVAILSFHGFGANAAAALTVVMNWDLCAFLPMLGIQIGVITLVSQCLGKGNKHEAERAAYSGFKIGCCYLFFLISCFLLIPQILIGVFTPANQGIDYGDVIQIAIPMLRSAGFYLFFDSINTVFSGALRGGGDTIIAMVIGVIYRWFLASILLFTIHVLKWPMMNCWYSWIGFSCVGAVAIYLRFQTGHWKHFNILGNDEQKVEAG